MPVRTMTFFASLWVWPVVVFAQPSSPQPAAPTTTQSGPTPAQQATFGYGSPGAEFDPSTTADPGVVTRSSSSRPADASYGSSRTRTDEQGNTVPGGYDAVDLGFAQPEAGFQATTPEYHVVQKGDTLWGISGYYLRDPYAWPKVWSYNEQITNAHWIFPGDRVRLVDDTPGGDATGPQAPALRFSKTRLPIGGEQDRFVLNQSAYVDAADFDSALTVSGGADAKVMLGTLDVAYMEYPADAPPIPGERLIVYAPTEEIRDFEDKEVVGYLVEVVGEIEIDRVARKAAEGTIAAALHPVERGHKVGPLRRQFRNITPVASESTASGRVIATIGGTGPRYSPNEKRRKQRVKSVNPIAGESQFVIVDLGAVDGVKNGNVLDVVRKGDEYSAKRAFEIPYEDGWPRRVIARLLVVETQEQTALCAVVASRRELERGEHVELNGPGSDAADPNAPRAGMSGSGSASGSAGDGKAQGSAGFKLGN